jgi:hypothetical protein
MWYRVIKTVLNVILGQHNKHKAAVHLVELTGPLKKKFGSTETCKVGSQKRGGGVVAADSMPGGFGV